MWKKALFIAIIILTLTNVSIKASVSKEQIEVYRQYIQVIVDNNSIELEEQPFIYNNRVYVPLRFVSNALGKEVEWVATQKAVLIKSPGLFIPVPENRPDVGEIFVYGKITGIDYENYTMNIEQHFDDNSIAIKNPLKVNHNVVVVLQGNGKKNIHFYQLKEGDVGGFILNSNGSVRGIIISRQ
jgi:hypothetical protein